ncbi:endonuclease/exonuclease/phosphatase family protein [Tepidicaulis sp.]|uniref:endonuclease/exonuclease/phosphatase family protein n=1 Tax=Tepidicaulis sp. TaxID=1920809 RepID=UPI003B5BCA05
MDLLLSILTLLTVLAAALQLTRSSAWWIRALDFPLAQFAAWTGLLLLARCLVLPETAWRFALETSLLILILAALLRRIWPYTPLHARETRRAEDPPANTRLRLLISNVLMTNRNAAPLIEAVKREAPDVLIALETDTWWQSQLDTLDPSYPHTLKCPLDNLYGMHIYSRLPLGEAHIDYLIEEDIPSMHVCLRLGNGRGVRLHALHPRPPGPEGNDTSGERDAELIVVAKAVRGHKEPVIVAGDLNDVAWSPTTRLFRKISQLLDPRIGRGPAPTFPAAYPFLRWPLDHLFHSADFSLVELKRLGPIGSDHLPILVDLALNEETRPDQTRTAIAEEEDRAWARQIVRQEDVSAADVPEPDTAPGNTKKPDPVSGPGSG